MEYVLSPGTNRYPRNDVLRRIAGGSPEPRPGARGSRTVLRASLVP